MSNLIIANMIMALLIDAAPLLNPTDQALISEIEFHSDDFHLTSRVNLSSKPFSTSVDTAQLLMDEMGYSFPILNIPLVRSFKAMDQGKAVCVVNKIKSQQRAEKYRFSLPLNYFRTQRLYQLTDVAPIPPALLNADDDIISLAKMLSAYPQSAIILPRDYSFGSKVDADIAQIKSEQIIYLSNQSYYSRFMKLFKAKKADFALIFPLSLFKTFGDDLPVKVRSYSIAGNPRFRTGHIICADSNLGERVIQVINRNIRNLYSQSEFVKAHTRYLPDDMRNEIHQEIQARNKHKLVDEKSN